MSKYAHIHLHNTYEFTVSSYAKMTKCFRPTPFWIGTQRVQRRGLRCRWELSQICDSKRAFKIVIYSKVSLDVLPLWSRFWKFWANHLKLRLQLHKVPVHETHSATVGKITTTSKTPSLTRIEALLFSLSIFAVSKRCKKAKADSASK